MALFHRENVSRTSNSPRRSVVVEKLRNKKEAHFEPLGWALRELNPPAVSFNVLYFNEQRGVTLK